MRLPILVLLFATILAGCAMSGGPAVTEEARCRQQGGVWQTSSAYCESGSGGGGY